MEILECRELLAAQPIDLVDSSLTGLSGMLASSAPTISADGELVAFESLADNLVPNDTDGSMDAFVYNRSTGVVTLVSVGLDGMAAGIATDNASPPVISPDGQYVAFESTSGDLVPGFTNSSGTIELYLRDLQTGTTALISAAPDGTPGNFSSSPPIFSADSDHLGFISGATNLVSGITYTNPGQANIFERNLETGTTTLVDVSLDGTSDANGVNGPFDLNADGRYVVFQSTAINLTTIDTNNIEQIYVRDTVDGTTVLASVDTTGQGSGQGHNELASNGEQIAPMAVTSSSTPTRPTSSILPPAAAMFFSATCRQTPRRSFPARHRQRGKRGHQPQR